MRRMLSAASAAIVLFGGLAAVPAHAASGTFNCAGLQAALTAATAGDVITLDNGGVPCTGVFTLATGIQVTLQGMTKQDGFDGQGTNQSLTGSNVGATVIQNLTFTNGAAASGGAISISGTSSPSILNSVFLHSSSTGTGGAVAAGSGGGNVTVSGNVFGGAGQGSTATFAGGALAIFANQVTITNNQFLDNAVPSSNGFDTGEPWSAARAGPEAS